MSERPSEPLRDWLREHSCTDWKHIGAAEALLNIADEIDAASVPRAEIEMRADEEQESADTCRAKSRMAHAAFFDAVADSLRGLAAYGLDAHPAEPEEDRRPIRPAHGGDYAAVGDEMVDHDGQHIGTVAAIVDGSILREPQHEVPPWPGAAGISLELSDALTELGNDPHSVACAEAVAELWQEHREAEPERAAPPDHGETGVAAFDRMGPEAVCDAILDLGARISKIEGIAQDTRVTLKGIATAGGEALESIGDELDITGEIKEAGYNLEQDPAFQAHDETLGRHSKELDELKDELGPTHLKVSTVDDRLAWLEDRMNEQLQAALDARLTGLSVKIAEQAEELRQVREGYREVDTKARRAENMAEELAELKAGITALELFTDRLKAAL